MRSSSSTNPPFQLLCTTNGLSYCCKRSWGINHRGGDGWWWWSWWWWWWLRKGWCISRCFMIQNMALELWSSEPMIMRGGGTRTSSSTIPQFHTVITLPPLFPLLPYPEVWTFQNFILISVRPCHRNDELEGLRHFVMRKLVLQWTAFTAFDLSIFCLIGLDSW